MNIIWVPYENNMNTLYYYNIKYCNTSSAALECQSWPKGHGVARSSTVLAGDLGTGVPSRTPVGGLGTSALEAETFSFRFSVTANFCAPYKLLNRCKILSVHTGIIHWTRQLTTVSIIKLWKVNYKQHVTHVRLCRSFNVRNIAAILLKQWH